MRKILALTLFLAAIATSAFAVGEARLTGQVIDPEGNPLEGVTVEVTSATAAKSFKETFSTNKDGKFTLFVLDGTIPYKVTYSKEGYTPFEETMKLKLIPERNDRTITLGKGAAPGAAPEAAVDPAVLLYNEGAELANQGQIPAAIAKMEEAVAVKADLTAGWEALAKLYTRTENWPKAIIAAGKVLEISAEEPDMFSILAEAYDRTGDKAKAKEFAEKAPANPHALFNQAAGFINGGNDKDAEPLLKRAVDADPSFAKAQYELGVLYIRTGNLSAAKQHLEKYLLIEPEGSDAAVAKAMIDHVNQELAK